MKEIRSYLQEHPLAPNVSLSSVTVYEVSQEYVSSNFSELASTHLPQDISTPTVQLWVHFGVHSSATTLLLEQVAWNEMDFRVPDQAGYQPSNLPICSNDGDLKHSLACKLPLSAICERVTEGNESGALVKLSTDPGRFLCNYLYYLSLKETSNYGAHSLFIHVPPFETIAKETQLKLIHSLLTQLCIEAAQQ